MSTDPFLWYRERDSLSIGDVNRYTIKYTRLDPNKREIFLRLKNKEKAPIRAIHLLNGPFSLYCHVVPFNYDPDNIFIPEDIDSNKEVVFKNEVKPSQAFNVKLNLNSNSLVRSGEEGDLFQWEVDIVSQIITTRKTNILFELMIGDDLSRMKKLNSGTFHTITSMGSKSFITFNPRENVVVDNEQIGQSSNPQLSVVKKSTCDLWSNEPKYPEQPVHLIWLTHGVLSNLTADMLYMKDTLERKCGSENLLVRGYSGNAGRTEKGVKKLGISSAESLVELIQRKKHKIKKISFIAHSLGGLVQLYAIKHILTTRGTTFFEDHDIEPDNLFCVASPLLGILSEMSFLISWFLDLGTLGKTGRDLTLLKTIPSLLNLNVEEDKRSAFKPLLETLPDDPLQTFLGRFNHLTLYANAVNDGIVPLRTGALLYLDYEALGDVTQLQKNKTAKLEHQHDYDHHLLATNTTGDTVAEIPEEKELGAERTTLLERYKQLFSLNLNNEEKKLSLTRREKKFMRISAKGTDYYNLFDDDAEEADEVLSAENEVEASFVSSSSPLSKRSGERPTFYIPPKASAVESAINAILCPIPSREYIMNPESRDFVIFHDKYYQFKNLPKDDHSKRSKLKLLIFNYNNDWKLNKQVKIAKKYHTSDLNWRKILVNLPPDAHNNIIVRRRFPNGYGWGVVDHLCEVFMEGGNPSEETKQEKDQHRIGEGQKIGEGHRIADDSKGNEGELGTNKMKAKI